MAGRPESDGTVVVEDLAHEAEGHSRQLPGHGGEEGGVEALLDHAHVADQRPRQPGELGGRAGGLPRPRIDGVEQSLGMPGWTQRLQQAGVDGEQDVGAVRRDLVAAGYGGQPGPRVVPPVVDGVEHEDPVRHVERGLDEPRVGDPEHRRLRPARGAGETAQQGAAGDSLVDAAPGAPGRRERERIPVAHGADALGHRADVLVAPRRRPMGAAAEARRIDDQQLRDIVAHGHRPHQRCVARAEALVLPDPPVVMTEDHESHVPPPS